MTWKRALPVLVIAGLFDALRFMCEWLILFGPALIGLYCYYKVGGSVLDVGGVLTKACVAGATALGVAGSEVALPLGIILGEAVGLVGWLVIGAILAFTNRRIFTANPTGMLWFVGSLLISEIPFLDSIPAFTITLIKLYRTQIHSETAARNAYRAQVAAEEARERQLRLAQIAQMQALQAAQAQEAANDAAYDEAQAANDEQVGEIPAELQRAA